MLPDNAGAVQTSGGHERADINPPAHDWSSRAEAKKIQSSITTVTLAAPPMAASPLLSCSSMLSLPPTGTPILLSSRCRGGGGGLLWIWAGAWSRQSPHPEGLATNFFLAPPFPCSPAPSP
jgi:hypothetical protein